MSTAPDNEKSNCKLAQYYKHLYCSNEDLAKQIFLKEYNINYKLSAVKNSDLMGCTALHFAAERNSTCDIEFLLSHSANPTIRNQNGLTPLHFAVKDRCDYINEFYEVKSNCKLLLSAQMRSENLENPSDRNGLSHFHVACMADDAEAIELFLKSGVSVDETIRMDSPYFPGFTPLHLAARYCTLQAMKLLLKYGANTQLENAEGMTFLCTPLGIETEINGQHSIYCEFLSEEDFIEAIKGAYLEMMCFLLQSDSYTIDYAGLTHFHLVCSVLELSIPKALLQKITDIIHAPDMDAPHWPGYTALHFAAYSSIEMVKMLVRNGANILAKDAKGVTLLDMCIKRYKVKDIHAVLSLDANWRSILMSDRKTRLLSLIRAMADVNQFDNFLEARTQIVNTIVPLDSPAWQGFTPLHIAVMFFGKYNTERIIGKLMANGANICAQDSRGRSPIHLAFRLFGYSSSTAEFMRRLNKKIEDAIDEDNLSHLHIACALGDKRSVEKILLTNVDVDVAYKGQSKLDCIHVGFTPLHCSAKYDEIVELLLLHGANPLLKDANGKTAIHHSLGHNTLLNAVDLKDSVVRDTGLSHLHIACCNGNVAAAEKLLDLGANVNQALLQDDLLLCQDDRYVSTVGDTPLDVAYWKKSGMVELLLQRGAEILVKEPTALIDSKASDILKPFVSPLSHEDNLFKRLKKEIGLTMLHVACSRRDVDLIKTLLASGADVNAQINVRSRLWTGYTPLHCVMDDDLDQDENLDEIVRSLLDNGCDITLQTPGRQETALHLAYDKIKKDLPHNRYSFMRTILRAHEDYTVNPTTLYGLSHFHVACCIGDIVTVNQFLTHGAYVNQPTDFFKTSDETGRNTAGCTPLLLAASSGEFAVDPMSQLSLVDLLLNYGADANAEDVNGNTSLNYMARFGHKREDVILRLIKSEANVNSRNIAGETPLEVLMKEYKSITVDDIRWFLKFGCLFNVFNSTTDKGSLAIALTLISCEDLVHLIKSSMVSVRHLVQMDEMGRTVIHNIVSNANDLVKRQPIISDSQYITLIKELEKFDCDVDDQDALGRTALHLAVLFRNTKAISGLLMAGADVNVTDASGKTAFSYFFQSCRCSKKKKLNQFHHFDILCTFVIHLKKLLLCGLDVNQTNENLMFEAFEKWDSEEMSVLQTDFEEQVNEIKNLKIAQSKLTLGHFLSEIDAVVAYPSLLQTYRVAVDGFFKDEIWDFGTKYNQVSGILFLQYRKAVKRMELIKSAQSSLNILLGFYEPYVCSIAILKFLSNYELSSMIEATT